MTEDSHFGLTRSSISTGESLLDDSNRPLIAFGLIVSEEDDVSLVNIWLILRPFPAFLECPGTLFSSTSRRCLLGTVLVSTGFYAELSGQSLHDGVAED